jgi:CubicO group peptidase (beta-lactamase class C family)
MWWLGEDGAFSAQGTGEQYVWCDPARDLVVVVRWVTDPGAFVEAVSQ